MLEDPEKFCRDLAEECEKLHYDIICDISSSSESNETLTLDRLILQCLEKRNIGREIAQVFGSLIVTKGNEVAANLASLEAELQKNSFEHKVRTVEWRRHLNEQRLCAALSLEPIQLQSIRAKYIFSSSSFGYSDVFPLNVSPLSPRYNSNIAPSYAIFEWLLEIVNSIYQILVCAIRHNIPVRWFDFGLFEDDCAPSGGEIGFFVPINSVEILGPPISLSIAGVFDCLFLSTQNVESLVSLKEENSSEPAAVAAGV